MITEKQLQDIIRLIENEFEIENLLKKSRNRKYVDARRILFVVLKDRFKLNYTEIGRLCGKNHATVIYLYNAHQYITLADSFLKNIFEKVDRKAYMMTIDKKLRIKFIFEEVSQLRKELEMLIKN